MEGLSKRYLRREEQSYPIWPIIIGQSHISPGPLPSPPSLQISPNWWRAGDGEIEKRAEGEREERSCGSPWLWTSVISAPCSWCLHPQLGPSQSTHAHANTHGSAVIHAHVDFMWTVGTSRINGRPSVEKSVTLIHDARDAVCNSSATYFPIRWASLRIPVSTAAKPP